MSIAELKNNPRRRGQRKGGENLLGSNILYGTWQERADRSEYGLYPVHRVGKKAAAASGAKEKS